ncbi:MAG: hypothetical protein U9R74_08105 [Pseudomonadota bacterium]|nr:hypothetical protein [Pseudomonadota bacterium]
MPYQNDGTSDARQGVVAAGALVHYYGAVSATGVPDTARPSEEAEDYGLPLVLMVTAPLDQSHGSSEWSAKIRTVLGRALSEYRTETAYDWGRLVRSTRESLSERIEQRFLALAEEWRQSQGVSSSLTQLAMHPAYQQIIGMGEAVIPLILRELEKRPDHWFWALKSITGEDPVSDENRGNIRQMAADWLEWGKKQGYQW